MNSNGKIIKGKNIVDDNWQYIDNYEQLDELTDANIIIPLDIWMHQREQLSKHKMLGLTFSSDENLKKISVDLDHFKLVALQFASFTDGRAYTQARLLRERYDYKGVIRATGNVLRDQIPFMSRVGFNEFKLDQSRNLEDALKSFDEFSVYYQAAADDTKPIYQQEYL